MRISTSTIRSRRASGSPRPRATSAGSGGGTSWLAAAGCRANVAARQLGGSPLHVWPLRPAPGPGLEQSPWVEQSREALGRRDPFPAGPPGERRPKDLGGQLHRLGGLGRANREECLDEAGGLTVVLVSVPEPAQLPGGDVGLDERLEPGELQILGTTPRTVPSTSPVSPAPPAFTSSAYTGGRPDNLVWAANDTFPALGQGSFPTCRHLSAGRRLRALALSGAPAPGPSPHPYAGFSIRWSVTSPRLAWPRGP